jgi:hypothetical protein
MLLRGVIGGSRVDLDEDIVWFGLVCFVHANFRLSDNNLTKKDIETSSNNSFPKEKKIEKLVVSAKIKRTEKDGVYMARMTEAFTKAEKHWHIGVQYFLVGDSGATKILLDLANLGYINGKYLVNIQKYYI